ncbi:phage tail P2-like protein [Paenibacillus rhizosphaerae]|uniref:Phage tail P2-like protein n=1 Tax=Paenibacillus rhizosphaerae TaxID=297318 RepID=A0A839U099_9BACL|nr:phage tail protein I [Paenibacillus rhizosphaerae]MBB3132131.1 phage tail P2-like protein [Paenibacillus rhizosphaerae]
MTDVRNMSLLDLLPTSIKYDPEVIAIAEALDEQVRVAVDEMYKLPLFSRLDELTDEEADELAWQFHVDFYDPTLPIEQKRELVKNAFKFHRRKGTPAAIEDLITILFGEGKVEEWFEYNGQPGRFRVITNNPAVTLERAQEFYRAIESVKRLSAHLEEVILSQTESLQLYFGTGMVVNEHIIIR